MLQLKNVVPDAFCIRRIKRQAATAVLFASPRAPASSHKVPETSTFVFNTLLQRDLRFYQLTATLPNRLRASSTCFPPTTLRWSFSTCFQVSPSFEFVDFFPNVACPLPLQPMAVAGGGCIFTVPAAPPVRVDAGGTEGNNAGVSSILCFLLFAAACMQQDVSVSAYVFIRVPLAHALLLQRPSSRRQC